jgi:DNA-binding FadR family transcriptional regulator
MFGVGRSSIRDTLSMLAAARIIETWNGEGTFVHKKTVEAKRVKNGGLCHETMDHDWARDDDGGTGRVRSSQCETAR